MERDYQEAPVHHFSEQSASLEEAAGRSQRLCSTTANWTSVLARVYVSDGASDTHQKAPTPDQTLAILLQGECELTFRASGKWRSFSRGVGSTGMLTGGRTDVMRWRSIGGPYVSLHLYVPQTFFVAAAEEYRLVGAIARPDALDEKALLDPLVANVGKSIVRAMTEGLPDLYAESAGQFLARHLLGFSPEQLASSGDRRRIGRIQDRRISSVIEYMRANYMRPVSLAELAREACVSQHHFGHLFKAAVGITPHKYLTQLRLSESAALLKDTDLGIARIALDCGFCSVAHFSETFRRSFAQTPTEFRRTFSTA
jgi:AraC family transcriptional regulator